MVVSDLNIINGTFLIFYFPSFQLLLFAFILLNRKYGVQTSGCQFLFWFFLVILAVPQCRTEVRAERERTKNPLSENEQSWQEYKYISFMIYFAFSICMLLINCFADKMPRESKYNRTNVSDCLIKKLKLSLIIELNSPFRMKCLNVLLVFLHV